jgi:PAS domain S-box-containing protein
MVAYLSKSKRNSEKKAEVALEQFEQHYHRLFSSMTEMFLTQLRESEAKYNSLLTNMIDGFAYCQTIFDNQSHVVDFICLEINEAFTRITGLKKEDVVGKRITDVLPGIQKAHPQLFEISGEVALSSKKERFEVFFKPLDLWASVSLYSPVKGDFVIMFEDITERKKAETKLMEYTSR